jgi:hypothetical protein
LSFVVISCDQTNDSPVNKKYEIHAQYGKCLENNIMMIESDSSFTTIEYSFKNNVLTLKHFAAGFNCCFDYLLVNVSVNDNIITIKENDINPNCKCLCIRDINYDINIEPGTYQVKIIEPYLPENDSAIEFEVELKENSTGIKRFKRSSYPWF